MLGCEGTFSLTNTSGIAHLQLALPLFLYKNRHTCTFKYKKNIYLNAVDYKFRNFQDIYEWVSSNFFK